MDSFSKCVFVRAGKHTSVHDMHPHSNIIDDIQLADRSSTPLHLFGKQTYATQTTEISITHRIKLWDCHRLLKDIRHRSPAHRSKRVKSNVTLRAPVCTVFS